MRCRPHRVLLVLYSLWTLPSFAQSWTPVEQQNINPTGSRDIVPQTCALFSLDYQSMKEILWTAPHEYAQNPTNSNTIITVALADGTADMFKIVQYDMMEAFLAAQFPEMKTFRGISVSNPYRSIRIDWTINGFRAIISDLDGKTYIDPYQRNDLATRVVYYANSFMSQSAWTCGMIEEEDPINDDEITQQRMFGDCQFRSYRLAIATTGEYSNFFGATSPAQSGLVLSQVITAINRVNEVYEADLAVRLILIANTTAVFYYDPGGDPFSGDACTELTQNQNNMTAVIGSANYDVGHVFSVGSGGCAGLGVICSSGNKARGATGLSPPTGDPFYIDYVAHELGHQFGGNHTFNGTAGSCNGNRSASSAYEPGSGSTIMAYAGICGAQDIQPNSDDYFHARSLLEISAKLLSTGCAAFITLNNDAPVAASVADFTIPISTPFVLTASVTDPNGDPLSYCWEEYDLEMTSTEPPTSIDTDGPMFRSYSPVAIPQRYFPRLEDLTQNVSSIWEVLPSVTRTMNYRMTARDYHAIAGCTDEDDVVVTTNANAGPFVVTSQNSATTWTEGGTATITWDVANTTASPVSCANVDIRLSTNGGMTYPIALSLNEPNDGTATVSIPPGTTTTGRIMVKASNNIFFDINNANITIIAGLPNFTIALNPSTVTECNDGSVQTTVLVGQFMGFSDPVTLSALSLPPGASASFVPPIVNPGSNSTLTISNLGELFGVYTPTVRGTSTTGNKDALFTINLLSPPVSGPTLLTPANNTPDAVMTPLLDWQSIAGVTQYEYQIAYDNAFSTIVLSGIAITDKFQVTTPLIVGQQHFWRVRAANSCGTSGWSSTFSFTTISCFALMSSNVPITIPSAGTPTVLSTFNTNIDLVINDVNVINLMGAHSWVDDLKFSLISPDGTERLFWNQPCGNDDNFNINFDDEAPNNSWPCPATNGMTYIPDGLLNIFDGKHSDGIWTLKIQDVVNQDGGSLSSWGLKVCGDISCQLVVNQTSGTGVGSLSAAINCAGAGDTVRLSALLAGQTVNVGATPLSVNKNLVFLAEAPNINITGTGTRVFEIVSGVQAEFIGVTITAGTSLTGGAINNPGTVRIKDVTIEKNPAINGATLIQNTTGAQLVVVGNCFINQ
ncbi:MAG: proprotein convertase P-domain-containing protein [Saprospiraceae bacterium]|nr:proprotein convertase P-domain-containing protein [Saprospiraceae bacterium]